MTDKMMQELIAYYKHNDELADKHTRLAAEYETMGNMTAAAKHSASASINEARIDGMVSALRILGYELTFAPDTIRINKIKEDVGE